jgi:hypothetical protein
MPIIINEFEIITPQGEQGGSGAQPGPRPAETQAQPPMLRPEDVERILRRFYLRRTRLWAD